MKWLSRHKGSILTFSVGFGRMFTAMCIGWCFGWGDYPRSLAIIAVVFIVLRFLVKWLIPEPDRAPGFYWVKIELCRGVDWVPGELLEDGRWWYMQGPWALEEDEGYVLEIGERIER
jgi:hypothetical protein